MRRQTDGILKIGETGNCSDDEDDVVYECEELRKGGNLTTSGDFIQVSLIFSISNIDEKKKSELTNIKKSDVDSENGNFHCIMRVRDTMLNYLFVLRSLSTSPNFFAAWYYTETILSIDSYLTWELEN